MYGKLSHLVSRHIYRIVASVFWRRVFELCKLMTSIWHLKVHIQKTGAGLGVHELYLEFTIYGGASAFRDKRKICVDPLINKCHSPVRIDVVFRVRGGAGFGISAFEQMSYCCQ